MRRGAEVEARLHYDRATELEAKLARAEAALRFMLRAPWDGGGMTQWSVSLACNLVGHPNICDEPTKPCYCGWVKP